MAELSAAGWSDRLMKSFNRMEKPAIMFTIFCPGGIDFVGGYNYFEFLKQNLFGNPAEQAAQRLGKLSLTSASQQALESGEQVHEVIFQSGTLQVPQGWLSVASYF